MFSTSQLLLGILVLLCFQSKALPPAVLNSYYAVTSFPSCNPCLAPCSKVITASTTGLAVGDEVLLIQMKGAEMIWDELPTFGTITSYGSAGFHEVLTVAAINTGTNEITFTTPIAGNYNAAGKVQLVRKFYSAANYTVNVDGVTCAPWNGTTGGVLFMEVNGALTLNGNIDVTGMGFRGAVNPNTNVDISICGTGGPWGNLFLRGVYGIHDSLRQWSGRKGEGIVEFWSPDYDLGRGPLGNGGGGGVNHNSGGGGGANMGAGGDGGEPYDGLSNTVCGVVVQGMGGKVLNRMGGLRLFLGGGGGAGHENNNRGNSGGDGGGIIIIKATSIQGNGNKIISDGFIGFNYAGVQGGNGENDGGGGGGAGGSIKIECPNFGATALIVQARGGNGGSLNVLEHGPGGGGGGGLICFSSASVANPLVTVVSDGGIAGVIQDGTHHGAINGSPGITAYGCASLAVTPPKQLVVSLGADLVLCNPAQAILSTGLVTSGFTYTWYRNGTVISGATSPNYLVNQAGTYVVVVSNALCSGRDTVSVVRTGNEVPQNVTFCNIPSPVNVTLSITNPTIGANYGWFTTPGGTFLGLGTSFVIPNLTKDTVLYVIDTNKVRTTIGPTPGSEQQVYYQGNASSQDITLQEHNRRFSLSAPLTLRSLDVRAALNTGGCGYNNTFSRSVTIQLFQNGVATGTSTTATVQCDVMSTVTLNWNIPIGNNYEIRIDGNSPGQFYMNAQYTVVDIPSIINVPANYAWSGSFFNYKITYGNPCAAIPVYATRNCPLPVTFIRTEAQSMNSGWELSWLVSDEVDINYYVVEVSIDGVQFDSIGFVNSMNKMNYSFNWTTILEGAFYYRIKAVGKDSWKEWSTTKYVSTEGLSCFTIAPNPTNGISTMYIYSDKEQDISMELYNSIGSKVITLSKSVINGWNKVEMNLHDLSPGVYLIQLPSMEYYYHCWTKVIKE
ncbi:MAG: T9SS type A sorting domain-containing protein [Cytophagaceae bacterium]